MLKKSLRSFLCLVVAVACASPVAAQQRSPDGLTRFLDSIFKPNQGPGAPAAAQSQAPQPQATQPQATSPQAAQPQQPAPPTPAAQAPGQPSAAPKVKTAAPKPKAPAKQQAARPKPQPQAVPQPVEASAPAPSAPVKAAPAEPETKQAAPQPAPAAIEPALPVQAAEKPKAPDPAPAKVAEPPKPARSTPVQATAPSPTSVAAAGTPATPVSPPNPATPAAALERVNAYFNNMDQMSAHFTQKNPNGQQVEGTLSVRRPGQLHFAYAPPSTLEVVSDGRNVAIRDKRLGTNDVYPVSQTPLKFLVQDNVDLARDTKVRDVQIGRDGMITIRFDDSATMGGTSRITLRFDSRANALKQWTILDSQGYETTVSLSGISLVPRRNASAD